MTFDTYDICIHSIHVTFVYIRYMCRLYTHDTFDTYDRDGEGGALVIDEPVLQQEGGDCQQCDQIWQNFATLMNLKVFGNY